MFMSNIREHLDLLEFNNLSEDDQRELAHMVLNNMHQDLEEWAQLRELDMGKIKKWIKTGALAAALAGAGIGAAHAQDADWLRKHGGNQQQMQQRGGGNDSYNAQRYFQDRQQAQQGQNWQNRQNDQMRGYQQLHDQPGQARQWAQQRGWEPHPRWHEENPWAMINIEPPEEVLYFRTNDGQDIMFVPHPRQIDLMRAREMGGMIEMLNVPMWPEPIKAFVYDMDGVTYITALPGQLP
jgi:hypothetical protein